jgi:hypothetical protein
MNTFGRKRLFRYLYLSSKNYFLNFNLTGSESRQTDQGLTQPIKGVGADLANKLGIITANSHLKPAPTNLDLS